MSSIDLIAAFLARLDGRVHSRVNFSLTVIMSESNEIRLLGLKKNDFEVLSQLFRA